MSKENKLGAAVAKYLTQRERKVIQSPALVWHRCEHEVAKFENLHGHLPVIPIPDAFAMEVATIFSIAYGKDKHVMPRQKRLSELTAKYETWQSHNPLERDCARYFLSGLELADQELPGLLGYAYAAWMPTSGERVDKLVRDATIFRYPEAKNHQVTGFRPTQELKVLFDTAVHYVEPKTYSALIGMQMPTDSKYGHLLRFAAREHIKDPTKYTWTPNHSDKVILAERTSHVLSLPHIEPDLCENARPLAGLYRDTYNIARKVACQSVQMIEQRNNAQQKKPHAPELRQHGISSSMVGGDPYNAIKVITREMDELMPDLGFAIDSYSAMLRQRYLVVESGSEGLELHATRLQFQAMLDAITLTYRENPNTAMLS